MRKIFPVGIIVALVIFLRILLNTNEYLNYIVAAINIVALMFVLLSILINTKRKIKKRIDKTHAPKEFKTREKKKLFLRLQVPVLGFAVIALSVYMIFFCGALGNDIIALISLGLSVADDEITYEVAKRFKIWGVKNGEDNGEDD